MRNDSGLEFDLRGPCHGHAAAHSGPQESSMKMRYHTR